MNTLLTPSQTNLYYEIIEELKYPSLLRTNYILVGRPGVGKTVLGKYLSQREKGRYISFVNEYGSKFLKQIDLLDIDETDLLEFIRKEIIADIRNELFIIDDLEFIFNYMFIKNKIKKFMRNFKRIYYSNKILLILPEIYFRDFNKRENLFILTFTNEDKIFMADYYYIAKSVASDYMSGYYFKGE